jgi:hypothetical protein
MILKYQAVLVIIDTLGTTAGDLDTDRSSDLIPKLLKPLREVATQTGVAICLVHHNRKSQPNQNGPRAGAEMLGSVALHAWADCGVYAQTTDHVETDGSKVVSMVRQNKLASQEPQLKVAVPRMFSNVVTGERKLWEPEIVLDAPEPGPAPSEKKDEPRSATKGHSRLNAKLMGLRLDKKPQPIDRVETVIGKREAAQLVKRGILVVEGDRYRWVRR